MYYCLHILKILKNRDITRYFYLLIFEEVQNPKYFVICRCDIPMYDKVKISLNSGLDRSGRLGFIKKNFQHGRETLILNDKIARSRNIETLSLRELSIY